VHHTSDADIKCTFSLAHAQLHVFMKQIVLAIKLLYCQMKEAAQNIDLIILFGLEIQVP
jgi:hypothetical protein